MQQPDSSQAPPSKAYSDLSQRIRILEERYTGLRRKSQIADETIVEVEKDLHAMVQTLSEEITQLRRLLSDIDDKMDAFLEQVKMAAPREQVLVLKKYVEMWDPVHYLTQDEAKRLLEQVSQAPNTQ